MVQEEASPTGSPALGPFKPGTRRRRITLSWASSAKRESKQGRKSYLSHGKMQPVTAGSTLFVNQTRERWNDRAELPVAKYPRPTVVLRVHETFQYL